MLIKFSKIPTGDEVPPHIFGIASTSYRGLLNQKNQSILISGESGANNNQMFLNPSLLRKDRISKILKRLTTAWIHYKIYLLG